ncbi:MAG TPA: winged helix DNA-binding domain-containing protein [Pyrinomonadaceae bacterium]|nr:winged helix DNA-binding domain-containing protein [Pyrinomonadaceae bacterium]
MNTADLVSQRLQNQRLSAPDFRKPVDVVRWFGAVQSQDFEAAKWALALRTRSATNAAIEEDFNRGTILRTHVMRPTWHFVARDDIRWLLALTAPRVDLRCGPGYRVSELDSTVFKRSHKVLERALKDGKYLSRADLRRKLNESGLAANDTVRMGHILIRAELDRVICSGPRVGKQLTYALFDERVPAAKAIDRDEALARLTRLYFRSHGPATLQDFVWWSGLTTADAKRGMELVGRRLERVTSGEKVYWSIQSKEVLVRSPTTAHLLPVFDEYFVAYKDRQSVFGPQDGKSLDSLGPAIVIDGTAAGTWNKSSEVKFTRALKKTERIAVANATTRYAEFLGVNPAISVKFPGAGRRASR